MGLFTQQMIVVLKGKMSKEERKRKVKVKSFSRVRLFAIPWTVVYQASLSMGFSRQEYWSGLPFLAYSGPCVPFQPHDLVC